MSAATIKAGSSVIVRGRSRGKVTVRYPDPANEQQDVIVVRSGPFIFRCRPDEVTNYRKDKR